MDLVHLPHAGADRTQAQPPRPIGLQAEVPFTVKIIFGTSLVLFVLFIVGSMGG